VPEKEAPETAPNSPLLDLSDAAVKKLTHSAKKRGYVTHPAPLRYGEAIVPTFIDCSALIFARARYGSPREPIPMLLTPSR
jgi:hypothetical protein